MKRASFLGGQYAIATRCKVLDAPTTFDVIIILIINIIINNIITSLIIISIVMIIFATTCTTDITFFKILLSALRKQSFSVRRVPLGGGDSAFANPP